MKETKEKKIINFKKYLNKIGKKGIIVICISIVILFVILIITDQAGQRTISSKSDLVKVLDVSELTSAEYIYNGIAIKTKKDNQVAYYVNYKGNVKAGINIKHISYEEDKENKKVIVTIPEIEVFDYIVDDTKLDFIFLDESYNTETVHPEAFALSKDDLKNSLNNNKEFYDKARESVISIVKASIEPLINAKDNEYELVIQ